MMLRRVELSYDVVSGNSGDYERFRANDVFYFHASSGFFRDSDSLEELKETLLDFSSRGGGRGNGKCEFENVSLRIAEQPRYFRNYPTHRSAGQSHYISSFNRHSRTIADAVRLYEMQTIDYTSKSREQIAKEAHELRKTINRRAATKRRFANPNLISNTRAKHQRRINKRSRLLQQEGKSVAEIKRSREYLETLKEEQEIHKELNRLLALRTRLDLDIAAAREARNAAIQAEAYKAKQKRDEERRVNQELRRVMAQRHADRLLRESNILPDGDNLADKSDEELAELAKNSVEDDAQESRRSRRFTDEERQRNLDLFSEFLDDDDDDDDEEEGGNDGGFMRPQM